MPRNVTLPTDGFVQCAAEKLHEQFGKFSESQESLPPFPRSLFADFVLLDHAMHLQKYLGIALPTGPRQSGIVLQELHRPLPPSSEAMRCRNCTIHCPLAVRQGVLEVALPVAPRE